MSEDAQKIDADVWLQNDEILPSSPGWVYRDVDGTDYPVVGWKTKGISLEDEGYMMVPILGEPHPGGKLFFQGTEFTQ